MTRVRTVARSLPRLARACRVVEGLESRVLLSETVTRVNDINTTSAGLSSAPEHVPTTSNYEFRNLTAAGGKVFFTADRSPVGRELWVTDGTQAGTRMVKDINPSGSSMPTALTNVDGTLFFIADDGVHGFEPWKSDGTEAGTVMLKDITPGAASSNDPGSQPDPTIFVFRAALPHVFVFTTNNPKELWRSDGTAEGTYRVKEAGDPDDEYPYFQAKDIGPVWESHGLAYFTGSDPVVGRELWTTDGTVAGTRLLKDIQPGKAWSGAGGVSEGANGITYFTAVTGGDRAHPVYSIFRTDGTTEGTQAIFEGPTFLNEVHVFGGGTYFVPQFPGVQPTQVWRTDGTPQGTVKVIQFPNPDMSGVNIASVHIVGVYRDQLLLYAYTPETGWEYWLSDGTQQGTRPLMENPGPAPATMSEPTVAGDQLYFFSWTPPGGETGSEPHRSDGTPEGTVLLKDIVPGPASSIPPAYYYPRQFLPVSGGKVVFVAQSREPSEVDTTPGQPGGVVTYYIHDLFVTDGTPAGTEILETVPNPPPPDNSTVTTRPVKLVEAGGTVFFSGQDPDLGRELMATDGTVAGTRVVKDINPGPASSKPVALTKVNGMLYFVANDGTHGYELWKSDGTAAGTVMVKDLTPGLFVGSFQDRLDDLYGPPGAAGVALGNTFFFTSDFDDALWKSDGTDAGTVRVKSLGYDVANRFPNLSTAGGKVYFSAGAADSGVELWKTDGTAGGTAMVIDILPGPASSEPFAFTPADDLVYFTAIYPVPGTDRALFRTDGTAAGTIMLAPQVSGEPSRAAVGRTLFFVSGKEGTQTQVGADSSLWKTDGTVAGTVKVKDFAVAPGLKATHIAGTYPGGVLFTAYQPDTGVEFWKSDGTEAGTVLVKDFFPGPDGSYVPSEARFINGTIWMNGSTRAAPAELWKSDGTTAGTVMVKDVLPGPDGSVPRQFQPAGGGKVVFVGYSIPPGQLGYQEWDVFATDGTGQGTIMLRPSGASVAARRVFYNNSNFDGNNPAAGAADDGAIAPDKQGLLPGNAASFASFTSFSKGINGVMIDVRRLPAGNDLSADDFVIRSGSSLSSSDLRAGPSNVHVSVRRGAGDRGTDRITLTWPDYNPASASPLEQAVANGWLQVTVKANDNTGLATPDVFYFGNLIGETGDGIASGLRVNALDVAGVKRELSSTSVPMFSRYDFNRDGRVNALDVAAVKQNLGRRLPFPVLAPAAMVFAAPSSSNENADAATSLLRE